MGSTYSASNIQRALTDIITQNVTSSVQKFTQSDVLLQQLRLRCVEIAKTAGEAWKRCAEERPDAIRELCDPILQQIARCTAHNIDFSQVMNVALTSEQYQAINSEINLTLASRLEAALRTQYSLFSFDIQALSLLIAQTVNVVTEDLQDVLREVAGRQIIDVQGGTVELVSLKQTFDDVSRMFQTSQNWTNARNDLANELVASVTSQTKPLTIAFIVGGIVILVAILLVILIAIFRPKKKAQ